MPSKPGTHKPFRVATTKHQPSQQDRRTSAQRGYGYKWQQARAGYLAKHPLCVQCEEQDIVRAAKEVDHIIPHKGDMQLFWDSDNWQSLCKTHHSAKTAREDGGFGRACMSAQ